MCYTGPSLITGADFSSINIFTTQVTNWILTRIHHRSGIFVQENDLAGYRGNTGTKTKSRPFRPSQCEPVGKLSRRRLEGPFRVLDQSLRMFVFRSSERPWVSIHTRNRIGGLVKFD